MTKEEYDLVGQLYTDGFQAHISQEQYQDIIDHDLINREIRTKSVMVNDSPFARSSSHTTSYKKLTITAACGTSDCKAIISLTWLANPAVRSYDVIGALFHNVSRVSDAITIYADSNGGYPTGSYKYDSTGVGASVLLGSGSNIYVSQEFYVTRGGIVFGSYQHATRNTTLSASRNYSFDFSGYGNVFMFDATGYNIYDGMTGVDIPV